MGYEAILNEVLESPEWRGMKGLLAKTARSTKGILPSSDHIIVTLQEPLKGAQSPVAIPLNLELLPALLQAATRQEGLHLGPPASSPPGWWSTTLYL